MFDLIGFWGAVTLQVLAALIPLVIIASFVSYVFVHQVTRDEHLASRASNFFWDNRGYGDTGKLFGVTLHDAAIICFTIAGAFMWIALFGEYGCRGKLPYETVSVIANKVAPVFGYITAIALTYIGAVVVGRKAYSAYVKVNKAITKFNEHNG